MNRQRMKFVGNVIYLSIVYFIVISLLMDYIPEFINFWAMGLLLVIIFSAFYVNPLIFNPNERNSLDWLYVTMIDIGISFFFSDFSDFLLAIYQVSH